MKTLVRYKYGTPPHAIMSGTVDEIKAELTRKMVWMEYGGFYFDKNNPGTIGANLKLFRGPHPKHDYYMILDGDKWKNKQDKDKDKLPERDVPAKGGKWIYGAWTIVFVYSNRGNFVLKGYMREVSNELDKMHESGLRYFANFSMWQSGRSRSFWQTSGKDSYLHSPDRSNRFRWTFVKYGFDRSVAVSDYMEDVLGKTRKELKFKRLPKRWVPEIENIIS